jgi:hypothetical protein
MSLNASTKQLLSDLKMADAALPETTTSILKTSHRVTP